MCWDERRSYRITPSLSGRSSPVERDERSHSATLRGQVCSHDAHLPDPETHMCRTIPSVPDGTGRCRHVSGWTIQSSWTNGARIGIRARPKAGFIRLPIRLFKYRNIENTTLAQRARCSVPAVSGGEGQVSSGVPPPGASPDAHASGWAI